MQSTNSQHRQHPDSQRGECFVDCNRLQTLHSYAHSPTHISQIQSNVVCRWDGEGIERGWEASSVSVVDAAGDSVDCWAHAPLEAQPISTGTSVSGRKVLGVPATQTKLQEIFVRLLERPLEVDVPPVKHSVDYIHDIRLGPSQSRELLRPDRELAMAYPEDETSSFFISLPTFTKLSRQFRSIHVRILQHISLNQGRPEFWSEISLTPAIDLKLAEGNGFTQPQHACARPKNAIKGGHRPKLSPAKAAAQLEADRKYRWNSFVPRNEDVLREKAKVRMAKRRQAIKDSGKVTQEQADRTKKAHATYRVK
ncbi:hypothetical protein B0H14DRAFT_2558662 [Mycena olivaceomarginata]|nr:hypothetical protein B0H14DRAFT_2558662 [Mycena olivaceomarginata]